ncbi:FA complementation group M [Brevipalpus obovatus]|uniref:FA complementation group M n=1 Tax=Brevipalpus obovatus TaxID=246614 RepID=UPI003D9EEEFF
MSSVVKGQCSLPSRSNGKLLNSGGPSKSSGACGGGGNVSSEAGASTSRSSNANCSGSSLFDEVENDVEKAMSDDEINKALNLGQIERIDGFSYHAGRFWKYPLNREIRSYQFNIVRQCLFNNTLVVLPTGLGKTLIASVVMYNFYLWYPRGKIVFMAPTRPLVTQQMKACHEVVGIPMEDIIELTGHVSPAKRREEWLTHRLFFLTPQVIDNDVSAPWFPVDSIKCVVVDEAHKATGGYAYSSVISRLHSRNKAFRVLALSATPGKDLPSIKQVISNLLISKVEFREEDSIDVQQYKFRRRVQTIMVKLDPELIWLREKLLKVFENHLKLLVKFKAIQYYNLEQISPYQILMMKDQFEKRPKEGMKPYVMNSLRFSFLACHTLAYSVEQLTNNGFLFVYRYLFNREQDKKGRKGPSPAEKLKNDKDFEVFAQALQEKCEKSSGARAVYGHPKIEKLIEVVLDHFKHAPDEDSKVIIFAQYHLSVEEIAGALDRHRPLVKPMKFVGQAKMKQKDQMEIVKMFSSGSYNTLVATSVAEEGLDIGNVDLIICFGSSKSPIQLVQRMGRTGRRREGRIVVLLAEEGREASAFKESVYNNKRVSHNLVSGIKEEDLYHPTERLYPKGLKPICRKMFLGPSSTQENDSMENKMRENDEDEDEEKETKSTKKKRGRKSATPKQPKTSGKKNKREDEGSSQKKRRKKSKFDKYFETEDEVNESRTNLEEEEIKSNISTERQQNETLESENAFGDDDDFNWIFTDPGFSDSETIGKPVDSKPSVTEKISNQDQEISKCSSNKPSSPSRVECKSKSKSDEDDDLLDDSLDDYLILSLESSEKNQKTSDCLPKIPSPKSHPKCETNSKFDLDDDDVKSLIDDSLDDFLQNFDIS